MTLLLYTICISEQQLVAVRLARMASLFHPQCQITANHAALSALLALFQPKTALHPVAHKIITSSTIPA